MSRPLTTVALTALLLAAGPAVAEAKNYKGKSSQGRTITLRTGADGIINRAKLSWRAPCGQGYFFHGSTGWRPPLDSATADTFQDEGTYRTRAKNGERSRITTTFAGVRDPATDRWRGTLVVNVMVSKKGKVIDRCRLKNVTWRAR
ncbi:hypothetical protein OJ997_33970 [Solirubrobacter phytolaccae]|uniref:DUF2147 domain-containing protein n=1 Tax=Solirubrobacter phytolaccae TaxID=1404360 RepID=A0A9X3NEX9_9ACTN|nr:hypothetical protein [Solirubrobacter phytolaccae]MDA0185363.1 hypothetical protein [Solirubrobacter phytolaccae]